MKSFLIHVFWLLGVVLFLDASGNMLTTGRYTKKDVSLVVFICATLIIISFLLKIVFTHKEKPGKRGFFIKLLMLAVVFLINTTQFLTILSYDDIYLLFG